MSLMIGKDCAVYTIIVVSPLMAIMKVQVEQMNKIGVAATAIGILMKTWAKKPQRMESARFL